MSMTGVTCDNDCVQKYEALKTKSTCQGIEFAIEGDKIIAAKEFAKGTSWADFVKSMPNEARYYVWDFSFEDEGVSKSKLLFITWNPDSGKIKTKMLYAGSKDALKKKIEGGLIEVQANDVDDLDLELITGRARKGF
eukprot:TRINITY_DN506_c0_g1_i1.p1 TRINITY_DN506_c0_g1~~TRINITY_DN506_c0_g1_i1.p1  ORF type:complete len:155 (+),score=62.51 TRINITY_DN506_c0_g1_i1:56-466(+)